jgi:putative ABC transport system permease protein
MPRVVLAVQWTLRRTRGWFGAEASLATDNLPRDLSRTASTASGLMASAALTISTATFIVSFIASLNTWSDQTAPGDLFVTSGAAVAGLSARNVPMVDSMRDQLLAVEGVERIRRTSFADASYRGEPIKLIATDLTEFVKRSRLTALEGDADQVVQDVLAGAVAVSENFSRLHGVHRGDTIALGTQNGTHRFHVAGVVLDYTSDRGTVLFDRATYVATWNDTRVDTFELHLKPGVKPGEVSARIDDRLGANHDLFVLTNAEFRGEILRAIDGIFSLMRVLELVTLLVAALGMLTSVLANVLDRVREIGVLRAIGMLRAQVRKLIVIESTFVGVIGAIAGTFVGVALGYLLLRRIATVQIGWYLPYRLPIAAILEFAAITLPVSALAGLYPAREAARLQIRDALDYE